VGRDFHRNEWAYTRVRKVIVISSVILLLLLFSIQSSPSADSSQDHSLPFSPPEENEKTDADPPVAPVLASALLEGSSNENILVGWSLSIDDGTGDNDVSNYAIYCSDVYDYEGDGYSYLGQVNSGETYFIHTLAGDGDWNNHFYHVQANDTSGNSNWSGQAGKFVRFLEEGKQIASIPLIQDDTTLEVVLQTLDGSYKHVRYYKSSDQSHHWKSYWTFKTYRTLFDVDHTMGFWIDMTKDDHLVVAGLVPDVTQIELGHGWNFVGYPSFIERTVAQALAGVDWEKAQGYNDVPPFHLRQLTVSDIMRAGEGYWVWVDLPQVWEVSNKPSPPPYIVWTDPADGQTDVPLNATVFVKFSKEMNTSSVTWITMPDPAGYSQYWSEGNTLLEIDRGPAWPENTTITFEVTSGEDLDGNPLVPGPVPNPWSFTTQSLSPYIVQTDPYDGQQEVGLNSSITVWFSEPMNTSSVNWDMVPVVGYQPVWWNNNMTLTLDHPVDYDECLKYGVDISGTDTDGNPLVAGPVPNPFTFTTGCENPYILATDPVNMELDVPLDCAISVLFSEPMNTVSVYWMVTPNPGGWDAPKWYENDTLMVLNHSNPFSPCTTYAVEVTYGEDKSGHPLLPGPVPNPWVFITVTICPYIIATYPMNNQTNVSVTADIVVVFSQSMNASSLIWKIVPDPGGWNETWTSDTTLVLSHSNPYQPLTEYIFELTYVEDVWGTPLCVLPFYLSFMTTD